MLDSRDYKEIEKLKDLFIDEISTINKKGTLTPADGEASKIALEALNYIECLCCNNEEGMYSGMMDPYGNHVPYNGYSERRGRDSMGRYTSRSNHGETIDSMINKLEGMKRELETR